MNRTKIEWCDYTINPIRGKCPVKCSYCYARRMYDRFKWNPEIRYDPRAWLGLGNLQKPSRIFVGSTIELFHEAVNPLYRKWIFEVPLEFPQHTFIFLTKCPQNLPGEFPENCWVGVTATDGDMFRNALFYLRRIKTRVKYISLEPLLAEVPMLHIPALLEPINWLIIGQQTPVSKKTEPKIEWIQEIVMAADKAKIPVFLKNNLKPLYIAHTKAQGQICSDYRLRQEMPLCDRNEAKP